MRIKYNSIFPHPAGNLVLGRYPHRNEILGRPSTIEEIAFLQEPNSSF